VNRLLPVACLLFFAAAPVYAQTRPVAGDQRPAFDVVSIKPNNSATGVDRIRNGSGTLLLENVSLRRIIGMAYGIPDSQFYLLSGPDWLDSENFDIQARYAPDTPESATMLMLQRLLEERFRMLLHHEAREFFVLALVPGKTGKEGLRLHPAAEPGGPYKFRMLDGHAAGSSISMPMLAGRLSRPDFGLGRTVVDLTGIAGTFDLTLDWKPENAEDGNPNPVNHSDVSIFTAIEDQLGLKLEPRKVPLGVLVVDRVNKTPGEN
jgi:uncharacterized protein (TIGR03435 family)